MNNQLGFPSFDQTLYELNLFIVKLVDEYSAKKISSWDDLDERVKTFFTPERMDAIELIIPGWKKMASYSDGITLTHVTCVFLGVYMLPEYLGLSEYQKQIAKWIIMFHDIDKSHICGKKDTMHAFRSGVVAANILPKLGFPVSDAYHDTINAWGEFTLHGFTADGTSAPRPDNRKLPEILTGIEKLFGGNTPASLIVKTALLHISINIDANYPTPSPLAENEIRQFISPVLLPFLKVMMLSDTEGWSLFEPETRVQQIRDAHEAFERVERLISY